MISTASLPIIYFVFLSFIQLLLELLTLFFFVFHTAFSAIGDNDTEIPLNTRPGFRSGFTYKGLIWNDLGVGERRFGFLK